MRSVKNQNLKKATPTLEKKQLLTLPRSGPEYARGSSKMTNWSCRDDWHRCGSSRWSLWWSRAAPGRPESHPHASAVPPPWEKTISEKSANLGGGGEQREFSGERGGGNVLVVRKFHNALECHGQNDEIALDDGAIGQVADGGFGDEVDLVFSAVSAEPATNWRQHERGSR